MYFTLFLFTDVPDLRVNVVQKLDGKIQWQVVVLLLSIETVWENTEISCGVSVFN